MVVERADFVKVDRLTTQRTKIAYLKSTVRKAALNADYVFYITGGGRLMVLKDRTGFFSECKQKKGVKNYEQRFM